jgi:ABC-2 type transport system permease protein
MKTLWRVIVKEFQQLRRDKRMIPAMIVGPMVQLLTLGFAANNDVTDIPLVLLDDDHGAASRALVDGFTASGYFRLVGSVAAEDEIEPLLVRGSAQVALVIPRGFGRDVAAGRAPRVQLIVDGSDSNSAVVGLGYAGRIVTAAGAGVRRGGTHLGQFRFGRCDGAAARSQSATGGGDAVGLDERL